MPPTESAQSAVNSAAIGDTIILLQGVHDGPVVFHGKNLTTGSLYLLDGDSAHIAETIVRTDSLDGDSASCFIYAYGENISSRLVGLTLRGHGGTRFGLDGRTGGGVNITFSSALIEHCRFDSCQAEDGGGIRILGRSFTTDASARIFNCLFEHCEATAYGGGIAAVNCSLLVQNCSFLACSAGTDGGLSIAISFAHVANCQIVRCLGSTGGAFFGGCPVVELSRCHFSDNHTTDLVGYAHLDCYDCGLSASGCEFVDSEDQRPIIGISGERYFSSLMGNVIRGNRSTFMSGCLVFGDLQAECGYNIISDNILERGGAFYVYQFADVRIHHNVIRNNRSLHEDQPSAITSVTRGVIRADSNIISGNNGIAINHLPAYPITIHAENNWWGDASGPYHAEHNPGGRGDTLTGDSVLFIPWLVSLPDTVLSVSPPKSHPIGIAATWEIISLYPNPFNREFNISIAGFARADFSISLYNLLGQKVDTIWSGSLTGQTIHYQAKSEFSNGIYLVRVTDNQHSEVEKVLYLK